MRQHAYRADDDASCAGRGDLADAGPFADASASANTGSDSGACACACAADTCADAGSVAAARLSRV
jgi:hypothetical protein